MPIKSKDGRVLTTEEEQNARWVEHFSEVLNQPTPDNPLSLEGEEAIIQPNITLDKIGTEEVRRAIKTLKNNKAAGMY